MHGNQKGRKQVLSQTVYKKKKKDVQALPMLT